MATARAAAIVVIAAVVVSAGGCTSSPPAGAPNYRGRPIADTCSFRGADWLERPDREAREQPERVLDLLGVTAGMTVADVGAGTGYFTVRIAKRVGPDGAVIATDVQPEMVTMLEDRVAKDQLANVRVVRAGEHAANLPAACCDLVLMVDVYHELADPPGVMAGVRAALRAGGRLALVEYRGEDPDVPIKPEHKMTLARIRDELEPLGFAFVDSLEQLPDQRIVVFIPQDAARSK
jgi:predicted methyltransferase